jgi:aconitate hydratase
MANFVFRRIDPTFPKRAREWGGGIIVGGYNYGQGSSREHAALAPKALGVQVVVARSYARIHRRNLISQGIPALTFADDGGYAQARQGDPWELVDLRGALERGDTTVTARAADSGAEIRLRAAFSARERAVLLDGGLLAHVRAGGALLSAGPAHSAAVDQGSPITSPVPDDAVQ